MKPTAAATPVSAVNGGRRRNVPLSPVFSVRVRNDRIQVFAKAHVVIVAAGCNAAISV